MKWANRIASIFTAGTFARRIRASLASFRRHPIAKSPRQRGIVIHVWSGGAAAERTNRQPLGLKQEPATEITSAAAQLQRA